VAESSFLDVKSTLDVFVKKFSTSTRDPAAIKMLSEGFSRALEALYNKAYEHLLINEPRLSLEGLMQQILNNRNLRINPSCHFEDFYRYVACNLGKVQKMLIHDLSVESISRYGKSLISKLYTGNKELQQQWHDHITATYFGLWEKKQNASAYRIVSDELELINRKNKQDFFPAEKLRQHDDTVDGYIVHALSYGWFYSSKSLVSVSVLTEDPFEEVLARVRQYQAFLAYAQDPISPNGDLIPARIFHMLQPGTLYVLDRETHSLKCVTFHTTIMKKDGILPSIVHSQSEVKEINSN